MTAPRPTPVGERHQIPAGAAHTRTMRLVFADQTNHHGTLFGGEALALMTAAASHAAARRSQLPVVLAATERIDFRAPVREGDIAEVDAWVSRVGRSSLTVDTVLHGEDVLTGKRTRARGRPAHVHAVTPWIPGGLA